MCSGSRNIVYMPAACCMLRGVQTTTPRTLLIQADSFGTSVATTLRVYSETMLS